MKNNGYIIKAFCIVLALLILFCSLFTGCRKSDTSLQSSSELIVCVDEYTYKALKEIWDNYSEQFKSVTVTYEVLPMVNASEWESMVTRLRTEIMAGNGPDLFVLDAGYVSSYTSGRLFEDINKAMRNGMFCDLLPLLNEAGISENNFISPVMEAGKLDGKQYVVPLRYNITSVFTSERSREIIGESAFTNVESLISGIPAVLENEGSIYPYSTVMSLGYNLDPNYYSAVPLINYEKGTAQIDVPFVKNLLNEAKQAQEIINQRAGIEPVAPLAAPVSIDSYLDYDQSDRYIQLTPGLHTTVLEAAAADLAGYAPFFNPLVAEDGRIHPVISSFAGIRANSQNKLNAINLIKILLDEKSQSGAGEEESQSGAGIENIKRWISSGYPVRKDCLVDCIKIISENNLNFQAILDVKNLETVDYKMSAEMMQRLNEYESQLTSQFTTALFPSPAEIQDILMQYYIGELSLDTCIKQMQSYWDQSLSE